jgi:hypothetical protein
MAEDAMNAEQLRTRMEALGQTPAAQLTNVELRHRT